VVFGRIVEGMDLLRELENLGTESGAVTSDIIVSDCGQLSNVVVTPADSLAEIKDVIRSTFMSLTNGSSTAIPASMLSTLVKNLGVPFTNKKQEESALFILSNSKGFIELQDFCKYWLSKVVDEKLGGNNNLPTPLPSASGESSNQLFIKTEAGKAIKQKHVLHNRPKTSNGVSRRQQF
jgi:hypothetical protein